MRAHYLQHEPNLGLAAIAPWLEARGFEISCTRLDLDEPLPSTDAFDGLFILGGTMSVNDEARHPWLQREKRFIAEAIERGRIVVGCCLGAQLMANALGAEVQRHDREEVGWLPVRFDADALSEPPLRGFPKRVEVFHWHEDTFDLPAGARHIAESAACRNHGFLVGDRAIGLQAHFEFDAPTVDGLLQRYGHALQDSETTQSQDVIRQGYGRFAETQRLLCVLLDNLYG